MATPLTVWDSKMWPLAVLTGDGIYVFFFYMKMYGRLAGPKKSGRNNEVTRPDYRGGRKVGFHCTDGFIHHILL